MNTAVDGKSCETVIYMQQTDTGLVGFSLNPSVWASCQVCRLENSWVLKYK